MKKTKWVPIVALVGGIVGLVVRRFYITGSFEPDTGLPILGTPVELVMWALCVVLAVALLLLSGGKHQDFANRYGDAFAPRGFAGQTALLAGGFLFLVAGVLNVWGYGTATTDLLGQRSVGAVRLVLAIVAVIAGIAVIMTTKSLSAGQAPNRKLLCLPGFAACLWVMANYQEWAKSPITGSYFLEVLTLLLSMVACYFLASFGFGKGPVGAALFFAGESAAFCIMILADGLPLYDVAMSLGMAFYLLAMTDALAYRDGIPLPPLPDTPDCGGGSCAGCPSAAPDGGCPSAPQNPT